MKPLPSPAGKRSVGITRRNQTTTARSAWVLSTIGRHTGRTRGVLWLWRMKRRQNRSHLNTQPKPSSRRLHALEGKDLYGCEDRGAKRHAYWDRAEDDS